MGNTQGVQDGVFMSTGSLARLASGTYGLTVTGQSGHAQHTTGHNSARPD